MRRLTNLFMAVTALLAFACTTDTTEDLGVDLGVKTTLTLSLEESRTQLGEKAGEVYPLHWSEGDQIAVNGITSKALTEGGSASAVFTFDGTLDYPYCVVYPATDVANYVIFPATQEYTAGTFSAGSAPMYGYAENAENAIQMHHLTGVLRFAISGEATLSSIILEAESGDLSGSYSVDCTTGALTAVAPSKSVSLTFGEGLVLGAEATPIYVAVPAGTYGTVSATIYATSGEKMVVKFQTESKPIASGVVREFAPFVFTGTLADEFVIDSKEALIRFASNPSQSAIVTADIDMTGEAWSPIEGYGEFTFDGGNHSIKGLTAPLFGTTAASIKNLKLTDIAMNSSNRGKFGAIACNMMPTLSAVLSNCEVSGTITIENPSLAITEAEKNLYNIVASAGLVGEACGVEIKDCVNRANITLKQVATSGNTITLYPSLAGVVACANALLDGETVVTKTTVTNCKNYGTIKYEDNATTYLYKPYISGIVAVGYTKNITVVDGCENRGAISVNAVANGGTGGSGGFGLAGVIAVNYSGLQKNCSNYGDITADGDLKNIAIGGIVGYSSSSDTENCHNYATIEVKETATIWGVQAGGIGGSLYSSNAAASSNYTKNCSNNGPIKVLASSKEGLTKEDAEVYYYRIGGITGFCRHAIDNCVNNEKGTILTSGDFVNLASSSTERLTQIGGCVAYKTKGSLSNLTNKASVTVNTNFSFISTSSTIIKAQTLSIAGCACDASYTITNSTNSGKITFGGSFNGGYLLMGGVYSDGYSTAVTAGAGCSNSGTLEFASTAKILAPTFTPADDDDTLTAQLYMGGLCAYSTGGAVSGLENTGNIIVNGEINGSTRVAGCYGYLKGANNGLTNRGTVTVNSSALLNGKATIAGCVSYLSNTGSSVVFNNFVNHGKVTFNGKTGTDDLYVAGTIAYPQGTKLTNMSNYGTVELDGTFDGQFVVAGTLGYFNSDGKCLLNEIHNYAPVKVSGTYKHGDTLYLGGTIGYMQGTNGHIGIYNHEDGDITVDFTTTSASVYISGVACKIQDHSTDVENHGDITVKGNYADAVNISGVIATSNNYDRTNHINTGDILVDAKVGAALCIGVMTSSGQYGKSWTNSYNTGDITVSANTEIQNGCYIGAMYSFYYGNHKDHAKIKFDNCYNSGNILFAGKCGLSTTPPSESSYYSSWNLSIGGAFGQLRQVLDTTNNETKCPYFVNGFVNSGNITVTGECVTGSTYIGGIVGQSHTSTANWAGNLVNKGNITFSGKSKDEPYIGGIAGEITYPVANAKCVCDITAVGHKNVGMLLGIPYAEATKVTNGAIGGSITVNTAYDEDADDDVPVTTAITASNYHLYLYSSVITADQATADGCSYTASLE